MYDKVFVGRSLNKVESAPKFKPYTKVIVSVSDDLQYTAGDETGETLTIKSPWGTQKTADDLLKLFKGYRYQPFTAEGANINPAAEIGDGVTSATVYGGLFQQDITFGRIPKSDYSAPAEEQINHHYPYTKKRDRVVNREMRGVRSTLKVQAGLISARVEKTGGDRKSFGWEMEADHHSWYANGAEVVRFEKENFRFKGKIEATAGLIGGFTIEKDYMHTGKGTWDHCDPGEIYLGPQGINFSETFWVTASGDLHAESGTFNGTVRAGSIAYGGGDGTFSGGGITAGTITGGGGGTIAGGTVTTANTAGGINTSLGYADFANNVFNNADSAANIGCQTITVKGQYLGIDNKVAQWKTATIGGVTITYLGR